MQIVVEGVAGQIDRRVRLILRGDLILLELAVRHPAEDEFERVLGEFGSLRAVPSTSWARASFPLCRLACVSRRVANGGKIRTMPTMSMTVAQVVEETRRWPADQVEVLFERLLASHYRQPDPALDAESAEELKRRIDDIESGREAGIPGEEVMARVRKIVGL